MSTGKNVRTPQQQAELEEKLFPIVEKLIQIVFPDGKINMSELKDGHGRVLKVHVDEIDSDSICLLASLVKEKHAVVLLKRSGTGITIVISFAAKSK